MKGKVFIFGALVAIIASCGGKKPSDTTVSYTSEENAVREEVTLPAELESSMDSIAGVISSTAPTIDFRTLVEKSQLSLTEQQMREKPDYLLTRRNVEELVTLQEKNVVEAYLAVDQTVASLYGLDGDDYDADPSITNALQFYHDMKESNRLDRFFTAEAAYAVEMMYIFSRNPEIYMPAVTDIAAMDLCKHVSMCYKGLVALAGEYPELQRLADALEPLSNLPVSGTNELRHHLIKKNGEFASVRAAFLK